MCSDLKLNKDINSKSVINCMKINISIVANGG